MLSLIGPRFVKVLRVTNLVFQDTLLVAEVSNASSGSKGNQLKFKERRVFLFEQIILFSEMTEKKRGSIVSAHYVFKNSLKVSALKKVNFSGQWKHFQG